MSEVKENNILEDTEDPPNAVHLLTVKEQGEERKIQRDFNKFLESHVATSDFKEMHCQLPQSVRSTFLMSFSHDCTMVASTHGDHKIYVSDVKTGKNLHKLEGHPRTPWCIEFHPTSNQILASGCLGGEVRVWDLRGGCEKWREENGTVIASLTFHPFHQLLLIASGNSIYFWDWNQPKPLNSCSTGTENERVRFVKFDFFGNQLITGISNSPSSFCSKRSNPDAALLPYSEDITYEDYCVMENRRRLMQGIRPISPSHSDGKNSTNDEYSGSLQAVQEASPLPTSSLKSDFLSKSQLAHNPLSQSFRSYALIIQVKCFEHTSLPVSNEKENSDGENTNAVTHNLDDMQAEAIVVDIATSEFWLTFYQLKSVCGILKRCLTTQNHLCSNAEDNDDSQVGSSEGSISSYFSDEVSISSRKVLHKGNRIQCEALLDMFADIIVTLQLSSFDLTVICNRIHNVEAKVCEILELLNKSFEFRLGANRTWSHIFEARLNYESAVNSSLDLSPYDLDLHIWIARMILQLINQIVVLLEVNPSQTHRFSLRSEFAVRQFSLPLHENDERQELYAAALSNLSHLKLDVNEFSVKFPYFIQPGTIGNLKIYRIRPLTSDLHRTSTQFILFTNPSQSAVHNENKANSDQNRGCNRTNSLNSVRKVLAKTISFIKSVARPHVTLPESPSLDAQPAPLSSSSRVSRIHDYLSVLDIQPVTDDSSDESEESERPPTPPCLNSSRYYSFLNCRAFRECSKLTHRIQAWSFTPYEIPLIHDGATNIIVKRCVIHNDGSVDISQDGEKLVAIIPAENNSSNNLMFGIYSLRPFDMGTLLCFWGFIENAISVSFSPLSYHVVVGLASSGLMFKNVKKEIVAEIIRIYHNGERYVTGHVQSLTRVINNENIFQEVRLNSVRWLPLPCEGIAYATNRGCLCICKPMSHVSSEEHNSTNNFLVLSSNISLGISTQERNSAAAQSLEQPRNAAGTPALHGRQG